MSTIIGGKTPLSSTGGTQAGGCVRDGLRNYATGDRETWRRSRGGSKVPFPAAFTFTRRKRDGYVTGLYVPREFTGGPEPVIVGRRENFVVAHSVEWKALEFSRAAALPFCVAFSIDGDGDGTGPQRQ